MSNRRFEYMLSPNCFPIHAVHVCIILCCSSSTLVNAMFYQNGEPQSRPNSWPSQPLLLRR